ncbi:hypothetical protein BDZ97DRAFT_1153800 [Flammula alnicola]|nr:hypothetical protein BDZ97DRAFT_1153800 [Flammula alnicola]
MAESDRIPTSDIERRHDDRSYLSCKISDGQPCPPCMRLLNIDQEISKLMTERLSIKSLVNQNHDSIIHRLPQEIASHIFTFSVPTFKAHPRKFKKSVVSAPLTLGAICQRWRQIAWSTPHLWTTICINLLPRKFPQRGQLAYEWLSRSGDLPLSIYLYFKDNLKAKKSEHKLHPFIDLINQYSHRWYSLDLDLPVSLVSRFGRDSNSSTILHNLDLRVSDNSTMNFDDRFSLDNVLPSPQEVVLSGIPFECVEIAWNNITHVQLEGVHVDECIELLRRAPRMVRCDFWEVSESQETGIISETIVVHPALQSLSFSSVGPNDIDITFFNLVSFPSLTSFSCDTISRPVAIDAIVSFLTRSGCSLQRLDIFDSYADNEAFVQVVRTTPVLQHLSLGYPQQSVLNFFLQLLGTAIPVQGKDPEGGDILLRDLRSFEYTGEFNFSWEQILTLCGPEYQPAGSTEFLSTTMPQTSRRRNLSSLTVKVDKTVMDELYIKKHTLLQFMRLQKEGIKLNFSRRHNPSDIIKASKKFHGLSEESDGNRED